MKPTEVKQPPVSFMNPTGRGEPPIPMASPQPAATSSVRVETAPNVAGEKKISRKEIQALLSRAQEAEEGLPTLIISNALTTLFSEEELVEQSMVEITSSNVSGMGTVNDTRMGVVDDSLICSTCKKDNIECPGHLGRIVLAQPIYHPLYLRTIIQILKCVCNSCGGLLMSEEAMKEKGILRVTEPSIRLLLLEKECEGLPCRRGPEPGTIQCLPNPEYLPARIKETKQVVYRVKVKGGEVIEAVKPINEVEKILNSISEKDAKLMGFNYGAHPKRMILRSLPVIPPIARPPQVRDGVLWPNPITDLYIKIVALNEDLKKEREEKKRSELFSSLYFHIEHLMDNTDGKYVPHQNRVFESFKQLTQGKEGVIRALMMGKRVNYAARSVLSPDPSLKFGQIRVPKVMSSYLTVPVTINQYNLEAMTKLLRGDEKRKTSYITHITPSGGTFKGRRIQVNETHRKSYQLQIGDKVDRWLQNGDYIVFNRQPTLHKYGMMGYEVVLGDELTYGLHLSYTTPLNADFDGDEGQGHAPQLLDALAEAMTIMNVKQCIMNHQTNRPIMGAVYDTLSGAYLLTQPDTMVDWDDFNDCLTLITAQDSLPTLNERLEKYGVNPLSGRALFSALLPPTFNYEKGDVIIREGILIQGAITRQHIGTSHNSIIQVMWKDPAYGVSRIVDFLTDLPWVINRWLSSNPISVGLKDCLPNIDPKVHEELVRKEIADVQLKVASLGARPVDPVEAEYYEKQIVEYVDIAKRAGDRIATQNLAPDNAFRIMAKSGAKGTEFHIAQMIGFVGQQFVQGRRIKPMMTQGTRCSPYFPKDDASIEAYGFCKHSFLQGLTPAELFFHQYATRENLMDTATRTADSGSSHHRIVKALEDVKVAHDGSVRNSTGAIVQLIYGDDGMDAAELQMIRGRTGEYAFFIDIKAVALQLNSRYGY